MKQPDPYDDVAPSAPCAIAPGGTWQQDAGAAAAYGAPTAAAAALRSGYEPPSAAGLPVSHAALQPNYSMTGPAPHAGWAGVQPPLPAAPPGAALGPGGVPYHYAYSPTAALAQQPLPPPPPGGGGLGAPLLMPAPHTSRGGAPLLGGGGGGYYGALPGGVVDYGMGTDVMYATRAMRHGFLRKVVGIVAAQLLLTAAVAAPLAFAPGPQAWLGRNAWVVPLAAIVTFGALICIVCSEGARRSFPSNLILLGAFTAAQGVLVGVACAAYSTPAVLLAVVLSAAVCLALVAYALQTRFDFTAAGGMLYSATWVLLLAMLTVALVPGLGVLNVLIAGCGALVFSCYLVYDVQLLVSGEHSCAISVDEPVVAALNIYVDIINVFLFILQLLGRDDD